MVPGHGASRCLPRRRCTGRSYRRARLRRKNGSGRGVRVLGRDRLRAGVLVAADALGPERVVTRDHALAATRRRARRGTPDDRGEPRPAADTSCLSRTPWRPTRGCSPSVRGSRARHHRGEPPGAHPRQPRDGPVEQVRLARADHRQQVGDVGGLRDALRRHGRRLRGAEGRLQAVGLPAGPRGATSRPGASSCRRASSSGRRRRSCATSSATSSRCRPTRCSTRSSRATWRTTWTRPSWSTRGLPEEDVKRVIRHGRPGRVQAPPGAARRPDLAEGVRARPAAADHEPLPRG